MDLVRVFYTKINWFSTPHRTVCSQFHCKNAMNTLARQISAYQSMKMNRNRRTPVIHCAIIIFRQLKKVIGKVLLEIKRAVRRMCSIEKLGNHQ